MGAEVSYAWAVYGGGCSTSAVIVVKVAREAVLSPVERLIRDRNDWRRERKRDRRPR